MKKSLYKQFDVLDKFLLRNSNLPLKDLQSCHSYFGVLHKEKKKKKHNYGQFRNKKYSGIIHLDGIRAYGSDNKVITIMLSLGAFLMS